MSFKNTNLPKLLEDFTELDYNSKNGKIDLEIGLKSLISSI